jgi:hypothetical protein
MLGRRLLDLPVQLPAHPQEEETADEQQADDVQEPHGQQRQQHAEGDRAGDPVKDHLLANCGGCACSRHADDDRVVPGQDDVDEDHLKDGRQLRRKVHRGSPGGPVFTRDCSCHART